MAGEKTLIKAATDATTKLKNVKSTLATKVSDAENGFLKKQVWATIKQNVAALGTSIKASDKDVEAGKKALKPIKGKKGNLQTPADDLATALASAEAAVKSANGTLKVQKVMLTDIEKSDKEIGGKLKSAIDMGTASLKVLDAALITLPGQVSVIKESFIDKGVPASATRQPLMLLKESVDKLGSEITTATSVAKSLADLLKMKPSVFDAAPLAQIKEGEPLAKDLVTAISKARPMHQSAIKSVAVYAAHLAQSK